MRFDPKRECVYVLHTFRRKKIALMVDSLGFPHKIQHGDWFCGKLIGLCKILVNGYVVNVYNTHLHANYHHVIPKDIYLGHRICQAYELIQFIESTSAADTTDMTILLGDLNLTSDDLGFKLIQGILQLNDSFLQRINKVNRERKQRWHYK